MWETKDLSKVEKFAKETVLHAAEQGLTIDEFCYAADMAKEISGNSIVDIKSIEKMDFLSNHIAH